MSYLKSLRELFPSWNDAELLDRSAHEVEQHQQLLRTAVSEVDALRSRLAAAEAALDEAKRDGEIIEWLEANPEAIVVKAIRKSSFGRKIWWMGPTGDYDTLRESVAAARTPAVSGERGQA